MKKMKVPVIYSALSLILFISGCGGSSSTEDHAEQSEGESLLSDTTSLPLTDSVPDSSDGAVPIVLVTGEVVPGLENEVLSGLSAVDINSAGQISVVADYGTGSDAGTALLVGKAGALEPVLVSGQVFPDKPTTTLVSRSFGTLDEVGNLYINVSFTGDTASNGLYETTPGEGTFEPIVESEDLLAGFEELMEVKSIGRPAVSGRGASFKVNLTDSTSGGLFLWDNGEVLPVAPGFFTDAPQDQFLVSGSNCSITLDESEVDNQRVLHDTLPDGGVVFHASLTGNDAESVCSTNAIIRFKDGIYSILAESGGKVPETTDAVFEQIHLQSVEANGDIYFDAELGNSRASQWVYTESGERGLIFVGGEEVEIGNRVELIDESQSVGSFRFGTNAERRVSARIELGNGSVSLMQGTARLDQPYSSIENPGAAALTPILATLEPLPQPFSDDEFFTGIGTVLNRGVDGVVFEATSTSSRDTTSVERAIWLYTPDGGLEKVLVTEERAMGPFFDSDRDEQLFVTDSGAIYLSIGAASSRQESGLFQILGRSQ